MPEDINIDCPKCGNKMEPTIINQGSTDLNSKWKSPWFMVVGLCHDCRKMEGIDGPFTTSEEITRMVKDYIPYCKIGNADAELIDKITGITKQTGDLPFSTNELSYRKDIKDRLDKMRCKECGRIADIRIVSIGQGYETQWVVMKVCDKCVEIEVLCKEIFTHLTQATKKKYEIMKDCLHPDSIED